MTHVFSVFSILLAQLCFICVNSWAQTSSSYELLSLEESIQLALQNNATLLSTEQDITIAQQRIKEASFILK